MDNDLSMISNIFKDYNNRKGVELPATRQASDNLDKYLASIGLSEKQDADLHDLIMAVACENERQGFYHGFSAGLQLSNEMNSIYRIK